MTGIETPFVFCGVQRVFDSPMPLRDWPEGDRSSRIVVIVPDISRPELSRSLDMMRARLKRHAEPIHSSEVSLP